MTRKSLGVLLFVMILSTPIFAMQGRGGGGGGGGRAGGGAPGGGLGAPVGGPSIPSQGNRPASPGDQSPSNPGKPDSAGNAAADHKPDAASHAVDPTDTHGFKNYGQYVAANQVSEHLGITLSDLKGAMDANGGNLGKAIHTLRPDLSSNQVDAEVKKAEAAAKKSEAEAKKKART